MPPRSAEPITDEAPVLLSRDLAAGRGSVRVLTLNRPAKRNALNTELVRELGGALQNAESDESVLAVVLTGNGPSFCAGGDISELRNNPRERECVLTRSRLLGELLAFLPRMSVPVVAAVDGAALGAGAALALAADMTIAGTRALLGYPEIRDSVVPTLVLPQPVHLLGRKLAFELLTTGRRLTADEAREHGLVNSVVASEDLLDAAIDVATRWAEPAPEAMRETKRLFYRVADLPADAALRTGIDMTAVAWTPRT